MAPPMRGGKRRSQPMRHGCNSARYPDIGLRRSLPSAPTVFGNWAICPVRSASVRSNWGISPVASRLARTALPETTI